MNSDWGKLRSSNFVVRPRRTAVELGGEPRERETYVAKAASFRLKIGGVLVGLMEKAEMSGVVVSECGGG